MPKGKQGFSDEEALDFHRLGKPGKLEMHPTKPMATRRDLSLAYSPGVAVPVRAIAGDPDSAFDYTSRGNMVAVISNGTAILGLGNLGALASKPVMEGKAVLFKRFADVDAFDLEVDTEDTDALVAAIRHLGPSFGGINLEDIKAPDCFIVEQQLREVMDIPVFHDDQHGTAIIVAAGIINALHLTDRVIEDCRVVVLGAGAAGIAVLELLKSMGLPHKNALLLDRQGVIYEGRQERMNQWKAAHAAPTEARTLEDALHGADIFIGLAEKGLLNRDMVRTMADRPVIFALANPDPEITPDEAQEARPDAIVATGRSDYPNQVNNVLGFPYIFRGALDVRARTINDEMKIAAAYALADLARRDVPDEVSAAYEGVRPRFGPDYIIPVPFDPRLISHIPPAVAEAAMKSGVARRDITDMKAYQKRLSARLDPTAALFQRIFEDVQTEPKRVVFAEGEEESVIRAAMAFQDQGLGSAVLVGRDQEVREKMAQLGLAPDALEVINARQSAHNNEYTDFVYKRLQRQGFLYRDVQRMVNQDRNVFAAAMVACGQAQGMVTGVTRNYTTALGDIRRVLDPKEGHRVMGLSIVISRGRTIFVADTTVTQMPTSEELADFAEEAAGVARRFGQKPRVALLANSTFGHPPSERAERIKEAIAILAERHVDFEVDGEMAANVALSRDGLTPYPFARISGPANVLIMPAILSASISTLMLQELGGCTVIGPILVGLERPAQIAPLGAGMNDILTMAALAAFDVTCRGIDG